MQTIDPQGEKGNAMKDSRSSGARGENKSESFAWSSVPGAPLFEYHMKIDDNISSNGQQLCLLKGKRLENRL